MPEAKGFGRRGSAAVTPQFQMPPFQVAPDGGTEHLSENARILALSGEVLAVVGLLVALIASIVQALKPLATTMSQIYIPDVLWPAIAFTSPDADRHSQFLMPMAATLAWPALLVFGVFGVIRGRWVVVALCAAIMAFPWSVFGVLLPSSTVMLVILGCAVGLKLYRPSGVRLVIVLIIGLVAGPLIVGLLTSMLMAILQPGGDAKQMYRVVDFMDLQANGGLPQTGTDEFGRKIVRVTTLEGLSARTQREQGARAFVQAQERTMRGDVAGVIAALDIVESSVYVLNTFERDRLQVARNFATSMGGYGEAARVTFETTVSRALLVDNLSFYPAVALGLLGPLGDIVGNRINRRRQRIEAAQKTLAEQRDVRPREVAAERGFGRRETGAGIQSIAAIDGEATIDAIDKRLAFYWNSALILTVTAVFCVGAGLMLWLPPAASNTAFQQIALTSDGARWARTAGLTVIDGPVSLDTVITIGFIPGLIIIGLGLTFFRRLATSIGGLALAIILFWQVQSFFFVDHAKFELAPSAITGNQRAELERSAALPTIAEQGKLPQRFDEGAGERGMLQPPHAAYVLAQLDYLEGRPQDIGKRLLVVAANQDALTVLAHEQRFDLMREWAGANGHPVDVPISALNMITPMNFPRMLAVPSIAVGVVSGLGAVLGVCLLPVAIRRRRRIEDLVAQVRYRQDEYRTAR